MAREQLKGNKIFKYIFYYSRNKYSWQVWPLKVLNICDIIFELKKVLLGPIQKYLNFCDLIYSWTRMLNKSRRWKIRLFINNLKSIWSKYNILNELNLDWPLIRLDYNYKNAYSRPEVDISYLNYLVFSIRSVYIMTTICY